MTDSQFSIRTYFISKSSSPDYTLYIVSWTYVALVIWTYVALVISWTYVALVIPWTYVALHLKKLDS